MVNNVKQLLYNSKLGKEQTVWYGMTRQKKEPIFIHWKMGMEIMGLGFQDSDSKCSENDYWTMNGDDYWLINE